MPRVGAEYAFARERRPIRGAAPSWRTDATSSPLASVTAMATGLSCGVTAPRIASIACRASVSPMDSVVIMAASPKLEPECKRAMAVELFGHLRLQAPPRELGLERLSNLRRLVLVLDLVARQ